MKKMILRRCFTPRGIILLPRNAMLKYFSINAAMFARTEKIIIDRREQNEDLPDIVKISSDKDIIYSTYLSRNTVHLSYKDRKRFERAIKLKDLSIRQEAAIPLIVEKMLAQEARPENSGRPLDEVERSEVNLPYAITENINLQNLEANPIHGEEELNWDDRRKSVKEEIESRIEAYDAGLITDSKAAITKRPDEEYISLRELSAGNESDDENFEFGSCDPKVPISSVPCGGCGAKLHCQDHALPGFLPKEMFVGLGKGELRSTTCQRCYFLKHHQMALNVRVSPEVYPKLLEPIKNARALVIVVVDLLDIPCSIWPDMINIIGTKKPLIIVGNKVDLLPADCKNHLQRVKDAMLSAVYKTTLGKANIKYATLISAHTGFGIETLISKIQKSWGSKGDVYIVGCTNTGKSTLFNTLLGSDMCKVKASDLILRATTSPWPGTTMNMLKFPLLRPSGYRLFQRIMRLKEEQAKRSLKIADPGACVPNVTLATLSGHIGRTFATSEPDEVLDPFSSRFNDIPNEKSKILGINESKKDYAHGKWCYDTPGTVQPDQLINLLTHEELMMVLPKELIKPRTFAIYTGLTLFIGGLARLDLLYSPKSIRFTVYAAPDVPVTIVRTVDASAFYRKYLGSPVLGVPFGDEERLQYWPMLMPRNINTTGFGLKESCADVVLSSAGWVAITGREDTVIDMRGWTPGGRGIYLRSPSILPFGITLKGDRIYKCLAYKPHKLLVPSEHIQ